MTKITDVAAAPSMRRKFKVAGNIGEDTKVFGTTYGEVKKAIAAGFQNSEASKDATPESSCYGTESVP